MENLLEILNKALKGNYTLKKKNDDNFSITFNIYATPITIDVNTTYVEDRINAYETETYYFHHLKFRNIKQSIENKDFKAIKERVFFDEKEKDEDDFYSKLFERYIGYEEDFDW